MNPIPSLLLTLTGLVAVLTAIVPQLGSVAVLFAAITAAAWFIERRRDGRRS